MFTFVYSAENKTITGSEENKVTLKNNNNIVSD